MRKSKQKQENESILSVPFSSRRGFLCMDSDLASVSNLGAIVRQLVGNLDGRYPEIIEKYGPYV